MAPRITMDVADGGRTLLVGDLARCYVIELDGTGAVQRSSVAQEGDTLRAVVGGVAWRYEARDGWWRSTPATGRCRAGLRPCDLPAEVRRVIETIPVPDGAEDEEE